MPFFLLVGWGLGVERFPGTRLTAMHFAPGQKVDVSGVS